MMLEINQNQNSQKVGLDMCSEVMSSIRDDPTAKVEEFVAASDVMAVWEGKRWKFLWVIPAGKFRTSYATVGADRVEDCPVLRRYDYLKSIVDMQLRGRVRIETLKQLARVLVDAVTIARSSTGNSSWEECFEQEEKRINAAITECSQRVYTNATGGVAVCLLLLSSMCYAHIPFFLGFLPEINRSTLEIFCIGIFGGALGSMIPCLRRSAIIRPGKYQSVIIFRLYGATRVVMGSIFGLIGVGLVVSDQINLFGNEITNWTLFLTGLAAGFSENLVPNIIEKSLNKNDSSVLKTDDRL